MRNKDQIVLIARAHRFSPNSVENDEAILRAVGDILCLEGFGVPRMVSEENMDEIPEGSVYVSMGRSEPLLAFLSEKERQGRVVINSPEGVSCCKQRAIQMQMLERAGLPVAPLTGADGYWVKRGDGYAETVADVVYVPDWSQALETVTQMEKRGVGAVDVRAHVKGDLVKFYGVSDGMSDDVSDGAFLWYYYPGDDGGTKFGEDAVNGRPQHYAFAEQQLRQIATEASHLLRTDVYGGDCIVQEDGTIVLIDFNDWPSFSRCRQEGAKAIAQHIARRMDKGNI